MLVTSKFHNFCNISRVILMGRIQGGGRNRGRVPPFPKWVKSRHQNSVAQQKKRKFPLSALAIYSYFTLDFALNPNTLEQRLKIFASSAHLLAALISNFSLKPSSCEKNVKINDCTTPFNFRLFPKLNSNLQFLNKYQLIRSLRSLWFWRCSA